MRLLGEIFHRHGLILDGKTVQRTAVRAIILECERLLMIYSPVNHDYKFPGGGVEAGETLEQALVREVREECGVEDVCVLDEFGAVVEYDQPIETDYHLFRMTSRYFICRVGATVKPQVLDKYEQELEFTPLWISVDEAIENNQRLLASEVLRPRWVQRDTRVLEWVRFGLLSGLDNHPKSSNNTP